LKITNGCRYWPPAEIYSMIVVYLRRLGSFLKVLCFSVIPSIRPLAPIPCIRPVSSIFHRSVCMTFLMAGRSRSGNYVWITLVEAPLTRAASIRRVWRILTYGLRCKNLSSQCFPTSAVEPLARRIRLANIWICACVGARPRASWIRIYSVSRLSCTGDNFCWSVYVLVFDCWPARRSCKMVKGMPKSRAVRWSGVPVLTAFNAAVSASFVYEGIDQAWNKLRVKFNGCTARIDW